MKDVMLHERSPGNLSDDTTSVPEKGIRQFRAARSVYAPYVIIVTCGLVMILPVLLFGVPRDAYDVKYHVNLAKLFAQQVYAGDVYPRWLPLMNGGAGAPTFFYYPPGRFTWQVCFIP